MLNYDDPKWNELSGGYGDYNPITALIKLENDEDVEEAWAELWEELHHQGDIGTASYAAVPHLVRIHKAKRNPDWNLYALVSVIEIERNRKTNPVLPDWLKESYQDAWKILFETALSDLPNAKDEITVRVILGVIALAKGMLKLGSFIIDSDDSEISEYLEEKMSWSELYH